MTWLFILTLLSQFPHDVHAKNEIECLDCHTQAQTSTQSTEILLPPDSLCLDCHETTQGYSAPSSLPLWIHTFSHQKHQETACLTCHQSQETPQLPTMATCASCHDGQKAPDRCSTCHDLKEPRLQAYHPSGWRTLHAEYAQADEPSCLMCHDRDASVRPQNPAPVCGSCHTQENFALKIHPQNYRFLHPQEFEARTQDCTSCHQGFETCQSCHEKERIYPMDHNSIHWVAGIEEEGGLHAQEARTDPEKCLACHSREEGTCLTCHGGH